jgi:hypothetical protein
MLMEGNHDQLGRQGFGPSLFRWRKREQIGLEGVVLIDQLELFEIPALVEIVEGLIPGISLPDAHFAALLEAKSPLIVKLYVSIRCG